MTIATKKDFIDQFNEINALINSNHKFISNKPNPTEKRTAMRQINSEVGFEIEEIRLKLENNQKVSEDEITQIRTALANYYSSRHAKNVFARFILNFLPALITGPIFHLVYWIIDKFVVLVQAAKKSSPKKISKGNPLYEDTSSEEDESENTKAKFRWDWTKAIPAVGNSFSTLKAVKNFLDDIEDFDISKLQPVENHQSEESDHEKSEKKQSVDEKDKSDAEAQAQATKEAEKAALAKRRAKRAAAKAERLRVAEEQSQKPSAENGKSELNIVKGVTARLKSALAKQEAKRAEAEAEKLRVAEEAKKASKVKFTFEPTIINSADLEVAELAPLAPISKIEPSRFQNALTTLTNFVKPTKTAEQVVASKALTLVEAPTLNAGQIVQYNAAQVQPSIYQQATNFAKKVVAPFVQAFNYFVDPTKLAFDLTSTFKMLVNKRPKATQTLALNEAETTKSLTKVEIVEHSYEGVINGEELVTLNIFVIFEGQKRSQHAFIYNVHGETLGVFYNADELRAAFPNIQFNVEIERNLLSIDNGQSDEATAEVKVEAKEPRVVVLEENELESAIEVAKPVQKESGWAMFKNKALALIESAKKKLTPKPKDIVLPTKPNADGMLQSPSNPTGLPLPRLAMHDDVGDVNYVNEARNSPSVVIDMDSLEDESQKGMNTSAILHTLSPAGLVVRDEQGSVLRAPNDTVVSLNLETESSTNPFETGDVVHDATWLGSFFQSAAPSQDPFEGLSVPSAVASNNPFVGMDAPVVLSGSNPFEGLEVPAVTEPDSELVGQGYVVIDLGDDGNDSSPEVF